MGARGSQQEEEGHFQLNIPTLPAEKWEVTKAGLLLPRQEMFLARAAHSAFLRDTFPAAGPAPELLPPQHRQHPRIPFPWQGFAPAASEAWDVCDSWESPAGDSTAGSRCSERSTLQGVQEFWVSSLEHSV